MAAMSVGCGLVDRSLGEIVREAMQVRGMNIKQLARRTAELGDPVSEGTVHNVLKSRVSHSRYDTIRPLCLSINGKFSCPQKTRRINGGSFCARAWR